MGNDNGRPAEIEDDPALATNMEFVKSRRVGSGKPLATGGSAERKRPSRRGPIPSYCMRQLAVPNVLYDPWRGRGDGVLPKCQRGFWPAVGLG